MTMSGQYVDIPGGGGGAGGSGAGGNGQLTVAMADANQSLNTAQIDASAIVNLTGALTADRTLTVPAPTGAANPDPTAYQRTYRNNTTGSHNVVITTGAGTTITLSPGGSAILGADAGGVWEAVTVV